MPIITIRNNPMIDILRKHPIPRSRLMPFPLLGGWLVFGWLDQSWALGVGAEVLIFETLETAAEPKIFSLTFLAFLKSDEEGGLGGDKSVVISSLWWLLLLERITGCVSSIPWALFFSRFSVSDTRSADDWSSCLYHPLAV
jgi:hypothetical protein